MTFSFAILLVNLQTTGLGPGMAFLVGVRWAISISGIEISTPAAWKRLRHNIIVSNAGSLAFISGRPTILRCIDNCSAESARWISQSLYSFWQDIQAWPELLQTFIRLLAKVIVRLDIKLQGVQSLVLWYRRSTHFAVIVGDISIVDAKFERILKVFNFFFQSSNFGFEAYIFSKAS